MCKYCNSHESSRSVEQFRSGYETQRATAVHSFGSNMKASRLLLLLRLDDRDLAGRNLAQRRHHFLIVGVD
jgi:hypothetical protein